MRWLLAMTLGILASLSLGDGMFVAPPEVAGEVTVPDQRAIIFGTREVSKP